MAHCRDQSRFCRINNKKEKLNAHLTCLTEKNRNQGIRLLMVNRLDHHTKSISNQAITLTLIIKRNAIMLSEKEVSGVTLMFHDVSQERKLTASRLVSLLGGDIIDLKLLR